MNISVFDEFEMLAETVLEREASREEIARFNELIREFPDLFSVYVEQLQMHLTLQIRCGQENSPESVHCDVRKSGRRKIEWKKSWWRSLWKAAAAAAILLGGAAVLREADAVRRGEFGVRRGETLASAVPAVMVVGQRTLRDMICLRHCPQLRLESGEVAVRLQTGDGVALIGLPVWRPKRVAGCCGAGSLLANVPHWCDWIHGANAGT
jgi:hypothetical protein